MPFGCSVRGRFAAFFMGVLIVAAAAAAYSNSFRVPFLFDDLPCTVNNPTIRHFWPIGRVLLPPGHYAAVQRRPVVNFSLAVNYAISGNNVWSYHALNLAAHALAALLLFGIIRRTLLLPVMENRFDGSACALAFAVALLWAVHPLLTDAVTYVIQRTEVLAGMFYLLTLYCTIRGASSRASVYWYAGAVAACTLAMGSKESAISAPLVILIYDRIFLSDSWRELFRRRTALYVGLVVSWLAILLMLPYGAEGTNVFRSESKMLDYLLAQPGAIAHYLRLCFWPYPLLIDYGECERQSVAEVAPYVLLIGGLFVASLLALWRKPWLGFLGVWFFAILAPSSSVVPLVQQVAGEKRMYLPLAAVITLVVIVAFWLGRRLAAENAGGKRAIIAAGIALLIVVASVLGVVTFRRNMDYRDDVSIWADTVAKAPNNARAHHNLAVALVKEKHFKEGLAEYRKTLEIMPGYVLAYDNIGTLLLRMGKTDEALANYRKALELKPELASAHVHMGNVMAGMRRFDAAIDHYRKALQDSPEDDEIYNNLGAAVATRGQLDEAISFFRRAVELNPDSAEAHNNLARALATQGKLDEAIEHFQRVLELSPNDAKTRENLHRAMAEKAGKK